MTKTLLRKQYLYNNTCSLVIATTSTGDLVGQCLYIQYSVPNIGETRWITQLVVDTDYRRQGVGQLLVFYSLGSHWQAAGLASPNPYAVKALERATRMKANPLEIAEYAKDILYYSNADFHVDHTEVLEIVESLTKSGTWSLGSHLPDGFEFFAFYPFRSVWVVNNAADHSYFNATSIDPATGLTKEVFTTTIFNQQVIRSVMLSSDIELYVIAESYNGSNIYYFHTYDIPNNVATGFPLLDGKETYGINFTNAVLDQTGQFFYVANVTDYTIDILTISIKDGNPINSPVVAFPTIQSTGKQLVIRSFYDFKSTQVFVIAGLEGHTHQPTKELAVGTLPCDQDNGCVYLMTANYKTGTIVSTVALQEDYNFANELLLSLYSNGQLYALGNQDSSYLPEIVKVDSVTGDQTPVTVVANTLAIPAATVGVTGNYIVGLSIVATNPNSQLVTLYSVRDKIYLTFNPYFFGHTNAHLSIFAV
eukprot:gene11190-13037_t